MAGVVPERQATPVDPWPPHGAYWHESTTFSNSIYSPTSCGEFGSHLSCRNMWEAEKIPLHYLLYLNDTLEIAVGEKKCYFCDAWVRQLCMSPLCSDFLSAWVPDLSSSWKITGLLVCVPWWWSGHSGHSVCALNCLPYWDHGTWSFKARNVTVVWS